MATSGLLVLLDSRTFTSRTQLGEARIQLVQTKTQPGVSHIRGLKTYTYDSFGSLPTGVAELTNFYTATQVTNVSTPGNSADVTDVSTNTYRVHQFSYNLTPGAVNVQWIGKIGQAASVRNVVLQVYNQVTPGWETVTTDSTTAAGASSTINGSVVTNFANYFDTGNFITFRVYQ